MKIKTTQSLNTHVLKPVVVIAALILLIILILLSRAVLSSKILSPLNLYPKQQTFTQLYFINHQTLPSYIKVNRTVNFAFKIQNNEGKDMTYKYEVYTQNDLERTVLDRYNVFIKDNSSLIINEKLNFTKQAGKNAIVVLLINKNQQIDFLVNVTK